MKTMNQEVLDALFELDADTGGTLLEELIAAYRSETPDRIPNLKIHFASQDKTKLAFEAHALKSTFGNFGADELADLLAKIETGAKRAQWEEVGEAIDLVLSARVTFESDLEQLELRLKSERLLSANKRKIAS